LRYLFSSHWYSAPLTVTFSSCGLSSFLADSLGRCRKSSQSWRVRGAKAAASPRLAKPVSSGTIQNFFHIGENSIFSSETRRSSTFFFRSLQNFNFFLQKFISPKGLLKKIHSFYSLLRKFRFPEEQAFLKEYCLFPSEAPGFSEGNSFFSSEAFGFLKKILQYPELPLTLYPLLPSGTLLVPPGVSYFSLTTSHFLQDSKIPFREQEKVKF